MSDFTIMHKPPDFVVLSFIYILSKPFSLANLTFLHVSYKKIMPHCLYCYRSISTFSSLKPLQFHDIQQFVYHFCFTGVILTGESISSSGLFYIYPSSESVSNYAARFLFVVGVCILALNFYLASSSRLA